MNHGQSLANKIAHVLNSMGHECTSDGGRIVLPKWGLWVDVADGKVNERPDFVSILPTITARHPSLPGGFARELGVGFGKTMTDAIDAVSANWLLLFFPLMKFMFEDEPHDCLVFDQPIVLPNAPADAGFRLFAGPVQTVGFENAGNLAHIGQTMLWEAFRDALESQLRPGVHHIRCYAGRSPQGISADMFLDGIEWPDGSQRLRDFAQKQLPEPDGQRFMSAVKQHLLIRPADLAAAVAWERADRIAKWAVAARDRIDPVHLPQFEPVLNGLFAMARYFSEEDSERALIAQGMPATLASDLTTFLPSAAARIVLDGKVQFSETYFWRSAQTNRAIERRYDQTPLFTAAAAIFKALYTAEGAGGEIFRVGSGSAEMNLFVQGMQKGTTLQRIAAMIHSTNEPVDGDDVEQLMAARIPSKPAAPLASPASPAPAPISGRPKWKFW